MFFNMCNSPATFQAMMDNIFKNEKHEGWVIVTPLNILRYNQAYKVHMFQFQVYARILTRSLSDTESQCSRDNQVDSRPSKEQAEV